MGIFRLAARVFPKIPAEAANSAVFNAALRVIAERFADFSGLLPSIRSSLTEAIMSLS